MAIDDYVARWKLKNNALDETGNFHGVETNGSVTFNGDNMQVTSGGAYIQTPYTLPAISQYSVSIWVELPSFSYIKAIGDAKNEYAGQEDSRVGIALSSYGSLQAVMGDGTSGWYEYGNDASSLQNTGKHHIVLLVDGTSVKYYIDKVLFSNHTSSVSAGTAGTRPFQIGAIDSVVESGLISDARIYERLLSEIEIGEVYDDDIAVPVINYQKFIEVSEDETATYQTFQDVSEEEDHITSFLSFVDIAEDKTFSNVSTFQDTSMDIKGYIEIFSETSSVEKDITFRRFMDISKNENIPQSISIQRVNA